MANAEELTHRVDAIVHHVHGNLQDMLSEPALGALIALGVGGVVHFIWRLFIWRLFWRWSLLIWHIKTFGPVILFGQGGTAAETIADRAVALPPLNLPLARQVIARTRRVTRPTWAGFCWLLRRPDRTTVSLPRR